MTVILSERHPGLQHSLNHVIIFIIKTIYYCSDNPNPILQQPKSKKKKTRICKKKNNKMLWFLDFLLSRYCSIKWRFSQSYMLFAAVLHLSCFFPTLSPSNTPLLLPNFLLWPKASNHIIVFHNLFCFCAQSSQWRKWVSITKALNMR